MAVTIHEPAREIPVYDSCDVLVVGAGPAGVTAAIAAKKNGAKKVVLLERYAYLGGMATGGQVLLIPFLSDGPEQLVAGLMNEWIDRLRLKPNGVFGPEKADTGSSDEKILSKYRPYGFFIAKGVIRYGVSADPEMLKVVLNELVEDYGITTYCHCWGVSAVTEGNNVTGVIFESKEGRLAITASRVIDCTGDGDIFASAGAEFDVSSLTTSRTSNTAMVYRLGGVDFEAYTKGLMEGGAGIKDKFDELEKIAGFRMQPFPANRNDQLWINHWIPRNCMTIKGLTDTAFTLTRSVNEIIEYFKANFKGMEDAYLLDFASQTGTRGSRRIRGTYRLTMDNIAQKTGRNDLIAIMPTLGGQEEYARMEIPYGVLVPEKLDGLLAAGRCFSSDEQANEAANWIPHCVVYGEAAGTAAALSLNANVQPRDVDIKALQNTLKANGVYLEAIL